MFTHEDSLDREQYLVYLKWETTVEVEHIEIAQELNQAEGCRKRFNQHQHQRCAMCVHYLSKEFNLASTKRTLIWAQNYTEFV